MSFVAIALAVVAVLGTAVIFGTDVLTALVLRPVYADVDDHTLVRIIGRSHDLGGRRLMVPGVVSVVTAALATASALIGGRAPAAAAAGAGLVLLLVWLVLFNRVSLPINKAFIEASAAGSPLANARALQDRWESIINLRATLQGAALVAFCAAIALA